MDAVEGEVVESYRPRTVHKTVEEVNTLALDRLYDLIGTADIEGMPALVECLAKYNTSIRNNTVLSLRESEEDRMNREQADIIGDALK